MSIVDPSAASTPTDRFCRWLIEGDSELARGVRARGWDFARRRNWIVHPDITDEDRAAAKTWLHNELEDIFNLAADGKNPALREEAFRVRLTVGRPRDVDVDTVIQLLRMLYRTASLEDLMRKWDGD